MESSSSNETAHKNEIFRGICDHKSRSVVLRVDTHQEARILVLDESLPEDGDVLDGAPAGRAILLGGLSPLAFPGAPGDPCFSMIQGGGRPDGSQGTRPSPLPHRAPL